MSCDRITLLISLFAILLISAVMRLPRICEESTGDSFLAEEEILLVDTEGEAAAVAAAEAPIAFLRGLPRPRLTTPSILTDDDACFGGRPRGFGKEVGGIVFG